MTSTVDVVNPATGSAARHLVCRGCGTRFPLADQHACYECFGPLEVGYDAEELRQVRTRQSESGHDQLCA